MMRRHAGLALATAIAALCGAPLPALGQGPAPTLDGRPALVIGHRGASGLLPEHTLEAYRLAVAQGADFIEPDLVATRDGALVARHDPMLSLSTDVASRPEFAGRRITRAVDGVERTDWFASDFTLAEIRTLRARQAMPDRDRSHDGRYAIPTLEEVIALAKAETARTGRVIGVYPETKNPTYHAALGLPLEEPLLAALAAAGWTKRDAPAIVQSFEPGSLRKMRPLTRLRLVQLVGGAGLDAGGRVLPARPYDLVASGDPRTTRDLVTPEGLAWIRGYADGIGAWKPHLLPTRQVDADRDGAPDDLDGDGRIDGRDRVAGEPTGLVAAAHRAGLFVHAWTFRSEPRWLPAGQDAAGELHAFLALGIDGLFTDHPAEAVAARDAIAQGAR